MWCVCLTGASYLCHLPFDLLALDVTDYLLHELFALFLHRAISMFRTSYSFVALSRAAVPNQLALMWYGNYNPASCSYAPFYVASEHLPPSYTRYVVCTVCI